MNRGRAPAADHRVREAGPAPKDPESTTNPLWQQLAVRVPGRGASTLATPQSPPDKPNEIEQTSYPWPDAGRPLDRTTRAYFEPRLGFDLSGVKLHDGPKIQRDAARLEARAFTVGEHIGLGADLAVHDGRRVLAHELAHVRQAYEGRAAAGRSTGHLEFEAERAAAVVDRPAFPQWTPMPAPALRASQLFRLSLALSSGNRVTDTAPLATDNIREEVLALLDRLHTMWSITNADYDNQYGYVHRLAPGSQVPQSDPSPPPAVLAAGIPAPWSFRLTIDAIRRNGEPSLAGPVINRYFAIPVSNSVGRGSHNLREDVLAVMTRLNFLLPYAGFAAERTAVNGLPAASRVADSALTATLPVITAVKRGLASGTLTINPTHADELEYGGADRLIGQTSIVTGDTLNVTPPGGSPAPFTKRFGVYIPRGASQDRNEVHIFFTPYSQPIGFVAEQGLRAQHDATGWILIAVPGLVENLSPNFVTIRTAEIQRCLTAAGRGTTIHAIRLSAHSRGHRGLENTINPPGRAAPLIDLGLIQRVTVFDASYQMLGAALSSRRAALTGLTDPANRRRFAPDAIRLFDVTVANVSGLPGVRLDAAGLRAIAYVRLVEEGLARQQISRSDLASLPTATRAATTRLLAALPARRSFSSRTPVPPGKISITSFIGTHRADLRIVDNPTTGLKSFVTARSLDGGQNFSRSIDAHHWFVAELGHEAVD
jgi:hypothetical protein